MTHTPISDPTRRALLAGFAATAALPLIPNPARALSQGQASSLIGEVMAEVQSIINSGGSEPQMIARFETLFSRYADVPVIARSALGPPARAASAAQLSAFTDAFRSYLARKYGRQFRSFIGATTQVEGARQVQSVIEVRSTMLMRGEAPFTVLWHVSDRSGRPLFVNIIIDGVNVLAAERQEIGTLLERRGGNIDAMIQDLRRAG
ncbi:MlaC/ttg2D family ABC transporter substrate-binding protein [Rhodobacter sp. NTK016B]|uniref:MlaC/ttg2D family ABC transporter substrate-binding protein n=1 Tax=Rhodobacter sp. NTK016B TaxID=2759676 RepID=UPI00256FD93A|nr:ABC transporter substrate-binding protein [Rhodobacter sp. NTK016B]